MKPAGKKKSIIPAAKKSIPKKSEMKFKIDRFYFFLAAILLIAFLLYFKTLSYGFFNLDDPGNILQNSLIKTLSAKGIIHLYNVFNDGNYYPLTLLLWTTGNALGGANPFIYHLGNILLHLVNTMLVILLVRKISGKDIVALITGLLFALHPMHTEPVIWITSGKDLLYTFFFLISLLFYHKYLKDNTRKFYIFSLLFFLCSLLSKGMAVSLSLIVIAMDYLHGRKLYDKKVILEKIPFLLLSVIFGIIGIIAQQSKAYLAAFDKTPPLIEGLLWACYGLVLYIVKLFVPLNLSVYYPYPNDLSGSINPLFWLSLLIIPALILLLIYLHRRRLRLIFFSIVFFLLNIIFVLRIVPVSDIIIADRYSYLSSLGLFMMAAFAINGVAEKNPVYIKGIASAGMIYVLFIGVLTFLRIQKWENNALLWEDVTGKFPRAAYPWRMSGELKHKSGDLQGALKDYNMTISLRPRYADSYINRGNVKKSMGDVQGAMADFATAVRLNPNDPLAYNNRGALRMRTGDLTGATADFNKAMQLNPGESLAYINMGVLFLGTGDYGRAKEEFFKVLSLEPGSSDANYYLGAIMNMEKKESEAMRYYNNAITFDPQNEKAYSARGLLRARTGDLKAGISDFNTAITLNPANAETYVNRGKTKLYMYDKEGACDDWNKAYNLGYAAVKPALEKFCGK